MESLYVRSPWMRKMHVCNSMTLYRFILNNYGIASNQNPLRKILLMYVIINVRTLTERFS